MVIMISITCLIIVVAMSFSASVWDQENNGWFHRVTWAFAIQFLLALWGIYLIIEKLL